MPITEKRIKEQITDETERLERDIHALVIAFQNRTGLNVRKILKKYPDVQEQTKIKVMVD